MEFNSAFKGLNAKLNPICPLLALLEAHHILHVSRIRVKRPATNRVSHETSEFSRDERKESRLILKKQHSRATVSVSRIEGACEQGNETATPIKGIC